MTPKPDYWQHKLSVYLHDPPHKCLNIKGHEKWAKEIADLLHCSIADKEQYKNADMIASGMTRAALPGYDANENRNGAVDFTKSPAVTHPVVKGEALELEQSKISADDTHKQLMKLISADIAGLPAATGEEERARNIYLYLFFALKKRLRNENTGGLGAAWDLLPADSRMPDHSIWHHMALASAVASSLREDGAGNLSLGVFSITPVQPFIGRARKLRDHWVGSVILSYLAFTGIRHICENLGPDHIVYPSLHDQTLVEEWLGASHGLGSLLEEREPLLKRLMDDGKSIASFPNKFVFLAPGKEIENLCRSIQGAVQDEWLRIAGLVRDFIARDKKAAVLFDHQISDYWQFSFATARIPGITETGTLEKVLHREKWSDEVETLQAFASSYGDTGKRTARIYAATHSLIQGVLASSKMKPARIRKPQAGEKCPLCGEHEVLHNIERPETAKAREYADGVRKFWDTLRNRFGGEGNSTEIGKNERLCAVCCVKRFLPRTLKQQGLRDELLYGAVAIAESFPSTTRMAADGYLERLEAVVTIPPERKKKLIDALHETEIEDMDDESSDAVQAIIKVGKESGISFRDRDKYYAMLLMDGDKMGDLINGATINATWGDVIHPELKKRYENPRFQPQRNELKKHLDQKRTLNPALHAAISDSLNSFARFAVAPLVEQGKGRLIYAGGDDVCAILPLDTALSVADAIRKAYTAGFVRYTEKGVESLTSASGAAGKIGVHFGAAPCISISAGILIAHHKEPLREVLKEAHALLEGVAKKRAGRNALAIRLRKRSGGDRDFFCKWDDVNPFLANETILDSFRAITEGVGSSLSSSLLYRLSSLSAGLAPMTDDPAANRDRIVKLFRYEVDHSGLPKERRRDTDAERLAGITLALNRGEQSRTRDGWFNPEAAVIAGFMARKERQ